MSYSTVEKELLELTRKLFRNRDFYRSRMSILDNADYADSCNNTWLASSLIGSWHNLNNDFDYEEHNAMCRRAKEIYYSLDPKRARDIHDYAEMSYRNKY